MPSTARRSLKDRLEQARRENFIDLRVTTPAFDGLFVRCRSLAPSELAAAMTRKGEEAGVESAKDVLVSTCIGIWEEVDGKGVSPVDGFSGLIDLDTMELSGDLPRFSSPELAEALGVPAAEGSSGTLRALLAPNSSLRLMPYADAVADFTTGTNDKLVREARGN